MRLNLAHRFCSQKFESGQSVRLSAFEQIVEARRFFGINRDDYLSADFMRDTVPQAELHHLARALNTEPCL